MGKNLLFEIGTEELPSSCLIEGIRNIKTLLEEKLENNRLVYGSVQAVRHSKKNNSFC